MCPRPEQPVEDAETAADLVELLFEHDVDETAKNDSGLGDTPAYLAEVGHLVGTRGPCDDQLGLTRGQLLLLNERPPTESVAPPEAAGAVPRAPRQVNRKVRSVEIDWLCGGRSPAEARPLAEWFELTS